MVTYAQAQERAEEWVNGDVPAYQHREVRVREFELGFVVWAEDRSDGPRSDGGAQRLVIARDSGEATLWPALPVGEVIRRYEEEYGRAEDAVADAVPAPAARVDLNQTSFLLSPPEWLQEAADKLGIPDRRGEGAVSGGGGSLPEADAGVPGAHAASGAQGASGASAGVSGVSGLSGAQGGASAQGSQGSQVGASGSGVSWPAAGAGSGDGAGARTGAPGVPAGATPWAGTDTNGDSGDDRSVPLPATVFAPPLSDADDGTPSAALPDAETALMSGGSQLPPTAVAPALDATFTPGPPGTPGGPPPAPGGRGATYGYPQGRPPAPGAPAPGGPGAAYGYPQGSGAPAAPAAPDASAPGSVPGGTPPPPPGAVSYGYPQGQPPVPGTPRPGAPVPGPVPGGTPPPPPGSVPGGTPPPPPGAPLYGYPQGPGAPGAPAGPPPGGPQGVPAPGASSYGYPQGSPQPPAGPGSPGRQLPPNAGDIADAATSKAAPPRRARGAGAPPPPPGVPGVPGARPGSMPPPAPPAPGVPGAPGTPAGGYVPTQLVSALGPDGPEAPGAAGGPQPPGAPGMPHAPGAPNLPGAPGAPGAPGFPGAPGGPGAPAAPGAPGVPGVPGAQGSSGGARGAVHHAETVLAAPPVGAPGSFPPPQAPGAPGSFPPPQAPGAPGSFPPPQAPGAPGSFPPPQAPGAPGVPGAPGMAPGAPQPMPPGVVPPAAMPPGAVPPGAVPPGAMPPPPGQPVQPVAGQPTVGPGYQAVLRYRAQDGSEQQLIRRSAPGTPHPEWQIFHELRGMNVPPSQVLELHTELESCELPGAYCARMIREQWPQARIASIAPYGTDHASRQQGMQQLLAHQGELHQVADGPARPAPVRAPLPPVQAVPPIPPEGIAQELAAAFGPGVFRFEQAAVSRQGVPPVVAHTLVVAGLPSDMGPFFWAQAQPGRPVPTLAELAQERGVQPAPDAGSYLVMGSDFGKAICVQYGTANIVAVPVEAGPGGVPVPPQFVNTGLPEFARCLALLGRMWRLRFGLNQEQAGRWTVDFQAQLASLDPAALGSPESWWSVLLEQMWDGLL
ncbi:SUKH-4 family immunity protein [Streptomyces sp. NPDC001315]|uniref:SUKH-4 family immunity protein n=1 Tax=Streptomyces sp. NPDC001315 TaxID=3364562 RepID=UPI003683EAE3